MGTDPAGARTGLSADCPPTGAVGSRRGCRLLETGCKAHVLAPPFSYETESKH